MTLHGWRNVNYVDSEDCQICRFYRLPARFYGETYNVMSADLIQLAQRQIGTWRSRAGRPIEGGVIKWKDVLYRVDCKLMSIDNAAANWCAIGWDGEAGGGSGSGKKALYFVNGKTCWPSPI